MINMREYGKSRDSIDASALFHTPSLLSFPKNPVVDCLKRGGTQ
jgi:hypothetical protein